MKHSVAASIIAASPLALSGLVNAAGEGGTGGTETGTTEPNTTWFTTLPDSTTESTESTESTVSDCIIGGYSTYRISVKKKRPTTGEIYWEWWCIKVLKCFVNNTWVEHRAPDGKLFLGSESCSDIPGTCESTPNTMTWAAYLNLPPCDAGAYVS